MEHLSAAIEAFSEAADRLDNAVQRATRRAAAREDGAEAQGEIILRLRDEVVELKQALEQSSSANAQPARVAS